MFLFDLTDEQKELFVDLAILAMESNGVVDESEKSLLERYCREMAIEFRDKANIKDSDEVLNKLKDISNEATLRKITIEITALMYADDSLADDENAFLNKIQNVFQFTAHVMGELIFVTKHLMLSLSLIRGITVRV